MNNKNLRPLNKRTKSEQREIQKKGGEASGESRRERKRLKELASAMCEEITTIDTIDGITKQVTMSEAMLYGIFKKAIGGDPTAAKFIATLLGEYAERTEQGITANVTAKGNSDAWFDKLPDEAQDRIVQVIQDEKHKLYLAKHGKTEQN